MEGFTGAYFAKFYPSKTIIYYRNLQQVTNRQFNGANLTADRKKAYQGNLSHSTKRIIEERITSWYYITQKFNTLSFKKREGHRRQLTFCTLTLSSKQKHTDEYLKKTLLEQFLKRLKYDLSLENYFWKAEKQDNGNIHFHLVLDIYIDMHYLRRVWNEVQDYHGYLDDYRKKYNDDKPPSTDIKMLRWKRNPTRYIMKYVCKQNENNKITGRVYSMSSSLVNLIVPSLLIDSYIEDFINEQKKKSQYLYFADEFSESYHFKTSCYRVNDKQEVFRLVATYFERIVSAFYFEKNNTQLIELIGSYFQDRNHFALMILDPIFKDCYNKYKALYFRSPP